MNLKLPELKQKIEEKIMPKTTEAIIPKDIEPKKE